MEGKGADARAVGRASSDPMPSTTPMTSAAAAATTVAGASCASFFFITPTTGGTAAATAVSESPSADARVLASETPQLCERDDPRVAVYAGGGPPASSFGGATVPFAEGSTGSTGSTSMRTTAHTAASMDDAVVPMEEDEGAEGRRAMGGASSDPMPSSTPTTSAPASGADLLAASEDVALTAAGKAVVLGSLYVSSSPYSPQRLEKFFADVSKFEFGGDDEGDDAAERAELPPSAVAAVAAAVVQITKTEQKRRNSIGSTSVAVSHASSQIASSSATEEAPRKAKKKPGPKPVVDVIPLGTATHPAPRTRHQALQIFRDVPEDTIALECQCKKFRLCLFYPRPGGDPEKLWQNEQCFKQLYEGHYRNKGNKLGCTEFYVPLSEEEEKNEPQSTARSSPHVASPAGSSATSAVPSSTALHATGTGRASSSRAAGAEAVASSSISQAHPTQHAPGHAQPWSVRLSLGYQLERHVQAAKAEVFTLEKLLRENRCEGALPYCERNRVSLDALAVCSEMTFKDITLNMYQSLSRARQQSDNFDVVSQRLVALRSRMRVTLPAPIQGDHSSEVLFVASQMCSESKLPQDQATLENTHKLWNVCQRLVSWKRSQSQLNSLLQPSSVIERFHRQLMWVNGTPEDMIAAVLGHPLHRFDVLTPTVCASWLHVEQHFNVRRNRAQQIATANAGGEGPTVSSASAAASSARRVSASSSSQLSADATAVATPPGLARLVQTLSESVCGSFCIALLGDNSLLAMDTRDHRLWLCHWSGPSYRDDAGFVTFTSAGDGMWSVLCRADGVEGLLASQQPFRLAFLASTVERELQSVANRLLASAVERGLQFVASGLLASSSAPPAAPHPLLDVGLFLQRLTCGRLVRMLALSQQVCLRSLNIPQLIHQCALAKTLDPCCDLPSLCAQVGEKVDLTEGTSESLDAALKVLMDSACRDASKVAYYLDSAECPFIVVRESYCDPLDGSSVNRAASASSSAAAATPAASSSLQFDAVSHGVNAGVLRRKWSIYWVDVSCPATSERTLGDVLFIQHCEVSREGLRSEVGTRWGAVTQLVSIYASTCTHPSTPAQGCTSS